MSLLQPKQTTSFPPQGWGFTDAKTGFKVNGWEGTPQMHAAKIIAHRRANPKFYPTAEGQWFDTNMIVQEIYQQKAKTHPHLFQGFPDKGPPVIQPKTTQISPTTFCECGSNEFTPIYCKTCGGKKINGYKCSKCGKEK